MATWYSTLSNTSYRLRLDVNQLSQNAALNQSVVRWALYIEKLAGTGRFSGNPTNWSATINGNAFSGTLASYDFRNYSILQIAGGDVTVPHEPNGTKTFASSASYPGDGNIGTGSIGAQNLTLSTLTVIPGTPTAVAGSVVSDSQVTVSWAQSSASNGQPTSNTIRRSINGGAFADVVTIAPSTSSTLAAAENQKLVYQVRAANSAGSSADSTSSAAVYTSPAAPSGVSAAKDTGLNIDVSWTPNVAFSEHEHVVEFSTNGGSTWTALATVAAGTSTFKHMSPNAALVHVYRVRARNTSGGLTSSWVQSNSVQLLTAPNAPTLPAFASFADKAADFIVAWSHNPVDTTAQTAYEVQFSTNGGSSWSGTGKVTSTLSARTVAANTYAADVAVTVRVRTWGQATTGGADGTGASAWSTTRTVTFKTRPVATIISPVDASTWAEAELRVGLGFAQAEDGTFVSATLQLKQGSTVLETIQSTTLASTTFATEVQDGESYTVTATVTSSHGITSTLVDTDFSVAYTLPVAATVTVVYLPESGIAQLEVVIPTAGMSEEDAVTVSIFRTIDGITETVQSQFPIGVGTYTFLDTTPTVNGVNDYIVRTFSEDGAAATITASLTTEETWRAFLSSGAGYSDIVSFGGDLVFSANPSRATALVATAGRRTPIALFGENRGLTVSGSCTLAEGLGSTPADVEAFLLDASLTCYRDPSGRRMFGTVQGNVDSPSSLSSEFSFTVTEAS